MRRKALEELVIRLHNSCSISQNPLKSFKYVSMGVYLSSWVLQLLFSKTASFKPGDLGRRYRYICLEVLVDSELIPLQG